MDLEVKQIKGKWFVEDRETGELQNKGKAFPNRQAAARFVEKSMGAKKLSEGGESLMPKGMPTPPPSMPGGMPSAAALMGGGAMPMPGMPGEAPSKMAPMRAKPGGMY